eukprot:GHVP01031318.1.p1 GENE.GHVP01031318.1~~GHVP01031318.1.p1  ORF type:complete len:128 (-),score=7.95 GHVP01031318.1:1094-1477(-)
MKVYTQFSNTKDPNLVHRLRGIVADLLPPGVTFLRVHKELNEENVKERKLHALINSDLTKLHSHNPADALWSLYVDASVSGIGTILFDHTATKRASLSQPNLLHLPINELEFKPLHRAYEEPTTSEG